MAEITIGQYYHENSIVHKLDPRVKLFGTMLFIVALFCVDNYIGYGALVMALAGVIILSKIPFKKLLSGLKGIIIILLFGMVFTVLFSTKGNVIVSFGIINVTDYGIMNALFIGVRLTLLVIGSSVMTLTTKPADLSDGLEKSFGILKKVKVPVHEVAMIMSLALRFIPTLIEETEKIKKAQEARGADFGGKNILEKVKNFLPLLIPMFISSIKRALDLSEAMEARCYNGGNRTKLHPLKYKKRDFYSYVIYAMFVVVLIGIYFGTGVEQFQFLKFTFL